MTASPKGDVAIGPDVLVSPSPAFLILLEHYPHQIMFCAIINKDMGQAFSGGCHDWDWRVKLQHYDVSPLFSSALARSLG
jgi:hypothetical protein